MEKTAEKLSCAYSPCPNDTFIFGHLAQQKVWEMHLHDVETLNRWAFEERFDITKLSFHAWLHLQDRYQLLSVGAALGRGCGPLLITQKPEKFSKDWKIAVPGKFTTAHLLLRLWNPAVENVVFMPFNQIMDAVERGEVDAGVIIHEGRFVYAERGFQCLEDLGQWWEHTTQLPIPLGCIAAKKSLGAGKITEIEQELRESIQLAFENPDLVTDYVRENAQELEDVVVREHISTYVNDFSVDLGKEGHFAIAKLEQLACAAGIVSEGLK